MLAVKCNQLDVVKYLIQEAGASPHIVDYREFNALHYAVNAQVINPEIG
jgi:hypothetical protein